MPTLKKTLHFSFSALSCAVGVALLGYGMSVEWSSSTVRCNSTGEAKVTLGLFQADGIFTNCPFNTEEQVDDPKDLGNELFILRYIVIALIVLSLIGSAGSILITLYNSFSNPYVTFMGPVGLYACSGFSVVASFLALIFFVSSVHLTEFPVNWLKSLFPFKAEYKRETVSMQLGFYMIIPYIATNAVAMLLVYLYVHAAYTRQREQQKPTEDAPKEIMMY